MPRACTVCAHPKRTAIEAALAAGESQREVAARFGLSKTALVRHAQHAPPAPPKRTAGSKRTAGVESPSGAVQADHDDRASSSA